jgi:hypothetical protein
MLITVAMVIIVNTRRPIEYFEPLPPGDAEESPSFGAEVLLVGGGELPVEKGGAVFASSCVIGFGGLCL